MRRDYVTYEPVEPPHRRKTDKPADLSEAAGFGWGMLLSAVTLCAAIAVAAWLA